MAEKLRIPVIYDTVCIDDTYQPDRRMSNERRQSNHNWRYYDRREDQDKRQSPFGSIDIYI